jgi:hypothetical protein
MAEAQFMILAKSASQAAVDESIKELTLAVGSLKTWPGLKIEKWYVSQGSYDFVVIIKIAQDDFIDGQPDVAPGTPLPELATLVSGSFASVVGATTETLGLVEVRNVRKDGSSATHRAAHSCTVRLQNEVDNRRQGQG